MTRLGEVELIARYFAPLATDPAALGLLDDAAVIALEPGHDLVATADALSEGVHFFADDPPDAIARKALRVNLSDLAAKGARPHGYLMTLALPAGWTEDWLAEFVAGLREDQHCFGLTLLGGDTIRTEGPLTVSITALGLVQKGHALRRAAARPGERIYVSGTIGDAALGLKLRLEAKNAATWGLSIGDTAHLCGRYLLPRPRLALVPAQAAHARAAIDISDGLVTDIGKLCRAAGTGAMLELDRIPLSDGARAALAAAPGLLSTIVDGGDDYEIACTVAEDDAEQFEAAADRAGVAVSAIGAITDRAGEVVVIGGNGKPVALVPTGYAHF